ncbi:MAG: tetratricopeptide repeat protein [Isosphaeraceae bacterium]|nr:tetratricopeptide repeat protein [Isosphaeraceae bacterium]
MAVGAFLIALAAFASYYFDMRLPIWIRRQAVITMLWLVFAFYLLAAATAIVGTPLALCLLARRRSRSIWVLRSLALCISVLCGMGLLEGAAALRQVVIRRLRDLPTHFPEPSKSDETYIVVIGESSARGEPYHPWLSVGQVAAWQLEKVFPDRRFRVEMLAEGGLNLNQAIGRLRGLKRRPDAILVYSGHNEFLGRYAVSGIVWHYLDDDVPPVGSLPRSVGRYSPVCGLIDESMEQQRLPLAPPPNRPRELIDRPVCTAKEREAIRNEFRDRLEGLVAYCGRIHALPILVIPAGNDGGYPPNRSVLTPDTLRIERESVARDFRTAHRNEASDPAGSVAAYRRLLALQPTFAEAHYCLARLLEHSGKWKEAAAHDVEARDADGMPLRCPSDFQQIYRNIASRWVDVVLVDGPAVLGETSRHQVLDDNLFHDAQHPVLAGYVALAQDLLKQLKAHRAFGWPERVPVPSLDPAECAAHFGIGESEWAEVCTRTALYYSRTALMRYDRSESLEKQKRYSEAAQAITDGLPPERTGIPGLGCRRASSAAPSDVCVESGRSRVTLISD